VQRPTTSGEKDWSIPKVSQNGGPHEKILQGHKVTKRGTKTLASQLAILLN